MTAELLRSELGSGTLLTLNRPDRRNALTVDLVTDLAAQIEHEAAAGARAVVIAGAGPAFCAGGDLAQLSGIAAGGAVAATDMIYLSFHRLVRAITGAPVPVIAAVGGAALGAGLDLALTCDLRICSSESFFASSWITAGLVPGMGGAFALARAVGSTRAAEILLLGQNISAGQALEWGLVNDVVRGDMLIDRCAQIVEVVARLPEHAIVRTKQALRRSISLGLTEELAVLGATQGALLASDEFAAFAERFRR